MTWEQTKEKLQEIDWSSYSRILFISKSIGTINAVAYSHGNQLACQHILFTPLDETFSFPIPDGIAFHGTADPWADTARLTNLARQKNVPLNIIEGANHSLETGDVLLDIRNLANVMQQVKAFIIYIINGYLQTLGILLSHQYFLMVIEALCGIVNEFGNCSPRLIA